MKAKIQRFMIALGTGFVALYASGCASNRYNLVKDGTVALEYMPSEEETYVSQAGVYRKGNGIEISGTVTVPQTVHPSREGHIDIAILAPDGSLLKKASIRHRPRNPRRTSAHKLPFEAFIPIKLPRDASIRIAYHRLPHSNSATFDCADNPATTATGTGLLQ